MSKNVNVDLAVAFVTCFKPGVNLSDDEVKDLEGMATPGRKGLLPLEDPPLLVEEPETAPDPKDNIVSAKEPTWRVVLPFYAVDLLPLGLHSSTFDARSNTMSLLEFEHQESGSPAWFLEDWSQEIVDLAVARITPDLTEESWTISFVVAFKTRMWGGGRGIFYDEDPEAEIELLGAVDTFNLGDGTICET